MSPFETDDGRLDGTRFGMALLELEAGTLDPVQRDALMALVARSAAAQRAYLEYFECSAMLTEEASAHAEQAGLPPIATLPPSARLFRRSLLAAAALVMLGALVARLVKIAQPEIPEMTVAAAAATHWSIANRTLESDGSGSRIHEGDTVRLESGTLELRPASGAAMVVQGPARVSFPRFSRPTVQQGWLWIDSGPAHESFEVTTPDLRIRTLGTRFGVRVPEAGSAEVHLIEGGLEVVTEPESGKPIPLAANGRGMVIPQLGEPTEVELARDPFPKIAELMAAPDSYPSAVQAQNPKGYWRFDEAPGGHLPNEVAFAPNGRIHPNSKLDAKGPGRSDGFSGFASSNRAWRSPSHLKEAWVSLGATYEHDGLLFQESFRHKGLLDGLKPEVALSETDWVSGAPFHADGTILGNKASATLAFDPVDGVVYTLEAELRDVTTLDDSDNWVALGFASGQTAAVGDESRFINGTVIGRAWMLFRGTNSNFPHQSLLSGASHPAPWNDWGTGAGGDVDLRIVLDTTAGTGNWTATWFARRPGESAYLKVRDQAQLPNEAINSVGIAVTGDDTRARIASISLRAERVVPGSPSKWTADGPAPLNRRAGALSFWLRRESGTQQPQILWSAGEQPNNNAVHTRLEADGRVSFFMENGAYDVILTSEETITDDDWHHLVASWSPYTVDLYLDGRPVAGQRDLNGLQRTPLPELRMGGGPPDGDAAPFHGWIDEVAVWDRMLTPIEVEQQYQSAVGK